MGWSWLKPQAPAGAPPSPRPSTHGAMRRDCRRQAHERRGLARQPRLSPEQQQRAQQQAEWIANVLRHHPLNEDLQRATEQSAQLLAELQAVVGKGRR